MSSLTSLLLQPAEPMCLVPIGCSVHSPPSPVPPQPPQYLPPLQLCIGAKTNMAGDSAPLWTCYRSKNDLAYDLESQAAEMEGLEAGVKETLGRHAPHRYESVVKIP